MMMNIRLYELPCLAVSILRLLKRVLWQLSMVRIKTETGNRDLCLICSNSLSLDPQE
jgi:hypothetical protein